jgi:hypothetical protein
MTDAVNINASTATAPTKAVSASAPASAAQATTGNSNSSAAANTKSLVPTADPGVSPRLVSDPVAGLIIQYLNSSGGIESQIPSSAVVAYLRAGLTADGFGKPIANAISSQGSPVSSTSAVA